MSSGTDRRKTLGLDLGTNSIGWAVIDSANKENKIVDKGVYIFSEGVKIEKGIESSRAAERTGFRSARRLKFRRKLRKYETLKALIEYKMCPLTLNELNRWVKYTKGEKREYPKNPEFLAWLKTDEATGKNPYYFRAKSAEEKTGLFDIGRAFYHMAQRRGFKSNRLETVREKENGIVHSGIDAINLKKGTLTLGQYFYKLYQSSDKIGSKIRKKHYTSREEHYLQEFNKICEVQKLDQKQINQLYKAIFYQRPLKSQKGLVGKCVFEKDKARCAVSHPYFEKFRMLSFVNNIRIKKEEDKFRPLTKEEKEAIYPLFFRKSKNVFEFEDIRKKLSGKDSETQFNYKDYTSVPGCPTSSCLMSVFGDNVERLTFNYKREKDGKETILEIHDLWHALSTFDNEEMLANWAIFRLKLGKEQATAFSKINLKHGYSNLSLNAIRKMLPFLEKGFLYTHSAYYANIDKALPPVKMKFKETIMEEIGLIIDIDRDERKIINIINSLITDLKNGEKILNESLEERIKKEFSESENLKILLEKLKQNWQRYFDKQEYIKISRLDEKIRDHLKIKYDITDTFLEKLYHPSDVEFYPPVERSPDGKKYLGSPIIGAIKNPMVMKTLHQLRKLINALIKAGTIDENTVVNVELARELNDANKRAAIRRYQKDMEIKRQEYVSKIREIKEPRETDIIKYQLWEEQDHICLYTGEQIKLSAFLSSTPLYDIEHTIPRSISFDDSQANMTLCDCKYNREVKKNKIPYECYNYKEILPRLNGWHEKIEHFEKNCEYANKSSRTASTKEEKDKSIQNRHYNKFYRDYWKAKYEKFILKEAPMGFAKRDLVDTGIITKYARLYMQTVFNKVYSVKGTMTAKFRKLWGLQNEYGTKERICHTHHAIDAMVIACMTKGKYNELSKYWNDEDRGLKPFISKPWDNFIDDVKNAETEILAKHYYHDNLLKQTKKTERSGGKINYRTNSKGEKKKIFLKGRTFRGSLHLDTFYGAIKSSGKEGNDKISYVVRKPLDSTVFAKAEDFEKIVDLAVREKVKNAVEERMNNGLDFKKALSETIWMNEGKKIPITKVRCFMNNVTNPIKLKEHHDKSSNNHKQYFYVTNDENYMMAIYEDLEGKKVKKDFILYNNFNIAENGLSMPKDKDGMKLKWVLKKGLSVILYENNETEISGLKPSELKYRLYKIIGFSSMLIQNKYSFGTISLRHNLEARPKTELKQQNGAFKSSDDIIPLRQQLHTQFNALVELQDFIITDDGKIKFLRDLKC